MGDSFRLDLDLEALLAGFEHVAKQMPFAHAQALTWTAKQAQAELQASLGDTFTIRSTWVQKGIRIKPAKKRALDVGAIVGSKDQFMERQAVGGTMQPRNGKAISVPLVGPGRGRTSISRATRKGRFPGKLIAKKKFFGGVPKGSASSKAGVWKRMGKGGRKALRLVYTFETAVDVPKIWDFIGIVMKSYRANMDKNIYRSWQRVITDAQKRAEAKSRKR